MYCTRLLKLVSLKLILFVTRLSIKTYECIMPLCGCIASRCTRVCAIIYINQLEKIKLKNYLIFHQNKVLNNLCVIAKFEDVNNNI